MVALGSELVVLFLRPRSTLLAGGRSPSGTGDDIGSVGVCDRVDVGV